MDPLREQALELAKGLPLTASNVDKVARATGPDAARWAFGQWELRLRASRKFAEAPRMLFVKEALEQATHEAIAAFHASRFPAGALVADLTCGIGADLIALAQRGPAEGYDLDEERVACARHNLRIHNLDAPVHLQDCFTADWPPYVFADPARRVEGKRTLDPENFAPNPQELVERMKCGKLGLIKLSPLLPDDFLESLGPRLEFVSYGGECREALVLIGEEAQPGRFAVHVGSGEALAAQEGGWIVTEAHPGEFLMEADPAAIRAHCLPAFGLRLLGDSNGYLIGPRTESPWLKPYEVLYSGKADAKETTRRIRELGGGPIVVKTRGAAGEDPAKLAKQFRGEGSRELVLAIWPVGKSLRHTLCGPLDHTYDR